jgi:uncharacterized protein (TIRG00374 family)
LHTVGSHTVAVTTGDDAAGSATVRKWARQGVWLAVTGVSFYLVLPGLLEVFTAWDEVSALNPSWFLAIIACQALNFTCLWRLQAIAFRSRAWFAQITSQLAGSAASRIIPGGSAIGSAVQYSMLRDAGVPTANAASGLTAIFLLQLGTILALPMVALPVVLAGDEHASELVRLAIIGGIVFVAAFAGATAVLASNLPLRWSARAVERVHNRLLARREPIRGLPERLLAERDEVRAELGKNWHRATAYAVGRTGFDYLALVTALLAVGSRPNPALIILAYCAASLLGLVPFTPGGLGFVEAGLTTTLVLAGVSPSDALAGTFLYRLLTFWLPIPIGLLAGLVFRLRQSSSR